jgi:hypothetical protein
MLKKKNEMVYIAKEESKTTCEIENVYRKMSKVI